jgi:hypothetical protein
MPITPASRFESLAELIRRMDDGVVSVNPRYQRSGQIWPPRAKSFLVETVLHEKPIPRVLLHEVDDPDAPHTSDIIDGQQRCSVLRDYRHDSFALTADVDEVGLRGKKYSDLTARRRQIFDEYLVPLDVYSGVTPRDIREVFRRLNYYTAPLNAAEQRHAQFYGELSRFVEDQADDWQIVFANLGIFTKRQLTRKADQQLLAEVVDAMINRIGTPTSASLRNCYRKHDRQFSSAADFGRRLDAARDTISEWTFLRHTLLRKHYQFFALILSVMHSQRALASLTPDLGQSVRRADDGVIRARFDKLEHAVRRRVQRGRYARFARASEEKTNVRSNRLIRCQYFYAALTGSARVGSH